MKQFFTYPPGTHQCKRCGVCLTPRESVSWCPLIECTETTRREPTASQLRDAQDALRLYYANLGKHYRPSHKEAA